MREQIQEQKESRMRTHSRELEDFGTSVSKELLFEGQADYIIGVSEVTGVQNGEWKTGLKVLSTETQYWKSERLGYYIS